LARYVPADDLPWPAGAAATYGQEMEPPVNRSRPAPGASAGAGESPDPDGDADVIEMGGHLLRWPWGSAPRPAIRIALAALVAGLLLGFLGGHLQAKTTGKPGRAAPAPPAGSTAISVTGNRCAVQLGQTLQLGIEIMNQSDRTAALRQVKPVLPLGGLHAIASQWGTCGSLPGPGPEQATSLAPGATGWLTITFDVMVGCPQPIPLGFKVSYRQAGRLATTELDSFPDLGQVRFNKCSTNPIGQ
jgi:hypothetical protein